MFTNARLFIKTAFLFLLVGLLSGLVLYLGKGLGWSLPGTLVTAHAHLILMGGVIMMILGVAVWFFPRARKDDRKYRPAAISIYYWVFTLSTSIRFASEILAGIPNMGGYWWPAFVSSLLQVLTVVGLVFALWGRIRPVGSQHREKRGERF